MKKYFKLNNNIILTCGYKKGLIHNLNDGKIFSIDEESKLYLKEITNGKSIESVVSKEDIDEFLLYLKALEDKNLGKFTNKKEISGKTKKEDYIEKKIDTIWLELRKACNLKCCHCYMDCSFNRDKDLHLLTLEEWENIINELSKYSPKRITLIGGEPLLFKDIITLIEYIKNNIPKAEIIIYSNLTLLNKKLINAIIKNNVKVVTSVYSNSKEIHDKITGYKGSFDLTISNVKRLRKEGVYVQANSVIMNYNKDKIDEIKKYLYNLTKVKSRIDIVRDVGESKKYLIPNELTEKYGRVKTKADFSIVKEEEFLRNYNGNSCWVGKVNITCDGYISPCIMGEKFINKEYNIRNNSLEELLEKYIIPEFWSISKDKIKVCKDCEYRYICKDCRPMSAEDNDIFSKGSLCNYNPYKGEWI